MTDEKTNKEREIEINRVTKSITYLFRIANNKNMISQ